MNQPKIVDISQYRARKKPKPKPKRSNSQGKGSVYSRGGRLWVTFRYLGERVREPAGLTDTVDNRKTVRIQLDLITAEIKTGIFEFAKRFPHSGRKAYFAELEGRTATKDPVDVIFGEYVKKWWAAMTPGMSESQIRDYTSILDHHLLPHFADMPFSEFWSPICLKKFIAQLMGKKTRYQKPLSAKRIQNIMIPLRVIGRDAIDEFGWSQLADPFSRLKLPKVKKIRIYPFDFAEWQILMQFILPWYRPYFEFAVQTGLRPSEQVALKWSDIDGQYIFVERSRVKNKEKTDLKTADSRRAIEIRPSMQAALEDQKMLTQGFDTPYVFINTQGRPILQDKLREHWARAMKKSGLAYRRMYECRHTFASWALGAGELPEWVARTLGHVDTSMIYKTYGRYIRNLIRADGTAFEGLYAKRAAGSSEIVSKK
jgi:integrase